MYSPINEIYPIKMHILFIDIYHKMQFWQAI